VVDKFIHAPGGSIGMLTTDDGRRIVFDAGLDLVHGRMSIEVAGQCAPEIEEKLI
jgi:hypothetical protein